MPDACLLAKGDAGRIPLPDRSVDLVIGSPPYLDCRTYGIGAGRKCEAWVEWMVGVTAEALRVSRGLVVWVVAGKTEDWCYQPGPEGLLWEWWRRGGECHCFRPCYWRRVGIPGSGGAQWYRADVEYALAFKRPGRLPHGDPRANGHPPKWAPGGEMSHRMSDGRRCNQWGAGEFSSRQRTANGKRQRSGRPSHVVMTRKRDGQQSQESTLYASPAVANPGNLIRTNVGGNQLGHPLAHENEAPYPVDVPAFFVRSHCPPGGLVCAPFLGSGTDAHAALSLGRRVVGLDLRPGVGGLDTARRRLADVAATAERPHRPKPPRPRADRPGPTLFDMEPSR